MTPRIIAAAIIAVLMLCAFLLPRAFAEPTHFDRCPFSVPLDKAKVHDA